jgi:hypothetical protein
MGYRVGRNQRCLPWTREETTLEFSDKTWQNLQQAKMTLAAKKITPQYEEYLKLREEIHAAFSSKKFYTL